MELYKLHYTTHAQAHHHNVRIKVKLIISTALRPVKEFIVAIWEVKKQKLYGEDTCPIVHPGINFPFFLTLYEVRAHYSQSTNKKNGLEASGFLTDQFRNLRILSHELHCARDSKLPFTT